MPLTPALSRQDREKIMSLTRFSRHSWYQVKRLCSLIWYIGLSYFVMVCLDGVLARAATQRVAVPGAPYAARPLSDPVDTQPGIILIGLGDSLTHGTMDGINNNINTLQAYLRG
jgi:hypothetical protein